jgi:hypothetical protein
MDLVLVLPLLLEEVEEEALADLDVGWREGWIFTTPQSGLVEFLLLLLLLLLP